MLPSFKNRFKRFNDPFEDPDFKRAWENVINLDTDPNTQDKILKPCGESEDNLYFHVGLNLDNIVHKKSPVKYINVTEKVPKYNIVEMLESVFHKTDLLSNNRFLNPHIIERLKESRKSTKQVRFNLTEIKSKHLPHCRRFLLNSEYGFLHASKCNNYLSEKELLSKEFQRRANFLSVNLKPEQFEYEFYYQTLIENSEDIT